jgi:hypothetical protein
MTLYLPWTLREKEAGVKSKSETNLIKVVIQGISRLMLSLSVRVFVHCTSIECEHFSISLQKVGLLPKPKTLF